MKKIIILSFALLVNYLVLAQSESKVKRFAMNHFEQYFNDSNRDPCEYFDKKFEKVTVNSVNITDTESAEDQNVAGKGFRGTLEITSYYNNNQYKKRSIKFIIETRPTSNGKYMTTDFNIWQNTINQYMTIIDPERGFQF